MDLQGSWVLSRPGAVYTAHLPEGGSTLEIGADFHRVDWYNPYPGGVLRSDGVASLMIQAVVFDAFGTLGDFRVYLSPYSRLLIPLELAPEGLREAQRLLMTTHLPDLEEAAALLESRFPGRPIPHSAVREAERELARHLESFVLHECLGEVVGSLRARGLKLALLSNLSTPYKELLIRLGIEPLFDAAVYSCDAGVLKPEAGAFRRALALVHAEPSESVMVGDSPGDDVEGARSAGMEAILIDPTGDSGVPSLRVVPGAVNAL